MAAAPSGIFSFSTEPSTELLHSSSWMTEGPQNHHDYPDNGSSHSGEAEEYAFASGHASPRGPRLDQTQAQSMSRASSSRSNISAISQSQMSNMSVRGNVQVFRNGSQITSSMAGMDSCLLLDSDVHAVAPLYWPDYALEVGLNGEAVPFQIHNVNPLHVSQVHLGHEAVPDTSSPSTWDCFSSSISRTSSPATIDESWPTSHASPASSPELACQSPSNDRKLFMPEEVHKTESQADDSMALPPPFAVRRQGSEGESARDHALYKNVSPRLDGLFHCPWEGQNNCNHKPEKLKCNYDKFVDSHLKPYRCKADACEGARFSSTACLLRHEREAHGLHGHGDKPFLCVYEGCERSVAGSGFPRQWNLRDHMKRVHNDHGSTGSSPTATVAQPTTKGRKRKASVSDQPTPAARKASIKSMPAEPKVQAKPLLEQWLEQRKAMEDILHQMTKPNLDQITEMQKQLELMSKTCCNNGMFTKSDIPTGRRHF